MSRRTLLVLYWASTGLLALFMVGLAIAYVTVPYFVTATRHIGFPNYFRYVLGSAKLMGAIVLVTKVPPRLRTFVHDGFAVMFLCGALAHIAAGDPPATALGGLMAFALLVVSCVTGSKLSSSLPQTAAAH